MQIARCFMAAALLLGFAASAHAAGSGAVCLAPFPVDGEAAPHALVLDPVTSHTTFRIRFGNREKVELKQGQTLAVSSLPLDRKIRVSIAKDGKPYESFVLNFADLKTGKVCMWLYLPYVTWQLSPYVHRQHRCRCFE